MRELISSNTYWDTSRTGNLDCHGSNHPQGSAERSPFVTSYCLLACRAQIYPFLGTCVEISLIAYALKSSSCAFNKTRPFLAFTWAHHEPTKWICSLSFVLILGVSMQAVSNHSFQYRISSVHRRFHWNYDLCLSLIAVDVSSLLCEK